MIRKYAPDFKAIEREVDREIFHLENTIWRS